MTLSLRAVYFGMSGPFSLAPLAALLAAGCDVRGVVVPAPHADSDVAQLARRREVPVFALDRFDDPGTASALGALQPDVACVACFSKRIPGDWLAWPRLGFLNVHPSLLPQYRGPHPLFWTFRDGVSATGVTIHFVDENLDTGDIAAQAPVALPDGVSGAEADRLCGELGGRLLIEVLASLQAGTLARRAQLGDGAYAPAPSPDDFTLDASWPARRAFNFMRGTAGWRQPYPIEVGGRRWVLSSAISFSPTQVLDQPCIQVGDEIWIRFASGVLRARTLR